MILSHMNESTLNQANKHAIRSPDYTGLKEKHNERFRTRTIRE